MKAINKLILSMISMAILFSEPNNVFARNECAKSIIIKNPSEKNMRFGEITYPPKGSDYSVWFPVVPRSLALDSKSNIYVGDSVKYRLLKFDKEGHFLMQIPLQPPIKERRPELSHYIQDIAIDSYDNVYVINLLEYRVEVYSSNGVFARNIDYYRDYINDLNSKKPRNRFQPKRISIDKSGNIYIYSPDAIFTGKAQSGGIYSQNGRLIKKGVFVDQYGRGKINFDEKQMVGFNGYYYSIETYAPDKQLPGKTIDKLVVKDANGKEISICNKLQIAKDEDGDIYKSDMKGNLYTFDYYNTLNVLKIDLRLTHKK